MRNLTFNLPNRTQQTAFLKGWSVGVPLHMQEITKQYNMQNYTDFYDSNPEVFITMKNVIKIKTGLKVQENNINCDILDVNGSSGPSGAGMYFRVNQYESLSDEQYINIRDLFPMKNLPGGYTAKLHSISDFDYDDDRTWCPSVSFSFYKDGENILTFSKKGFV